jgi:hypothetical protein
MIDRISRLWLVATILSSCLLHRQLIQDTFALEPNVIEHNTQGPRERNVKRPAHVLNILVRLIDLVPFTANLKSRRRKPLLKWANTKLGLVVDHCPVTVQSLVVLHAQLASSEGTSKRSDRGVELFAGHETFHFV